MRNMQRHNVTVLRRENFLDETDYTYYNLNVMMEGFKVDDTTFFADGSAGFVAQEWVKVYSPVDMPSVIYPTNPADETQFVVRSDYVFWEGRWYKILQESNFVRMGKSTYYERYAQWKSSDSDAAAFPTTPPAFETEYYPFLNVVGQLTMAVEMAYLPLINKLENL